jgi:hypothetical protein
LKSGILTNNRLFFNNLYKSSVFFFLKNKIKKLNFIFKKNSAAFIFFAVKNNVFIFDRCVFFKSLHIQLTTFIFFIRFNYKFFFFNNSQFNFNTNLLNINFLNFATLTKNFLFFFFRLGWFKYVENKDKFASFVYANKINFLFFFKPANLLNLMFFFRDFHLLLGGLSDKISKNLFFDYPLMLNNNNIFHIYFAYKFFMYLIC